MTIKKWGISALLLIGILSLALFLIYKKVTAPLLPNFTIEIVDQEAIDSDLQINLVLSNFAVNGEIYRQSYTLLYEGVIYPTDRLQDFPIWEVFIRYGDQFAYVGQENIFFAPDRSHPRARFDRYAKLAFSSQIINHQIKTIFQQFHNGEEKLYSESVIDLSSTYDYPRYPYDNEAILSDFTKVHH